jgi:hypothetical protein
MRMLLSKVTKSLTCRPIAIAMLNEPEDTGGKSQEFVRPSGPIRVVVRRGHYHSPSLNREHPVPLMLEPSEPGRWHAQSPCVPRPREDGLPLVEYLRAS